MHHSIINSKVQIKMHTLSDLMDGCVHAAGPVQESWWSKSYFTELHIQTMADLNKYIIQIYWISVLQAYQIYSI